MEIIADEKLRGRVASKMTLNSILLKEGARWEFLLVDPSTYEPI